MKSKSRLLFLSILTLFLFITRVDAGIGNESNPECDTHIDLYEISSSGFDVKMPVCEWDFIGSYEPKAEGESYQSAWDARKQLVTIEAASLSGKSVTEIQVPLCNDDSKVSASANCVATITRTTVFDHSYCTVEIPKDADGNPLPCPENKVAYVYTCPSVAGATLKQNKSGYNETCYYDMNVSVPMGDVTEDIDLSEAQTKCVSENGASSCVCSDATYTLNCPIYNCRKTTELLSPACTDKFKIGDNIAYCINPNDSFPEHTPAGVNNYIYDKRFDPNNCASSNSTIDCGHANILIESAWNKQNGYDITDTSIDFALRLWSAHNDRSGFELSGLPNAKGGRCNEFVFYMPGDDGRYTNVYKITLDYITRTYFETITNSQKYKVQELSPFFREVTCDRLGLACNGGDVLKNAFALYFNTLIGNKDMLLHLSELYNEEFGVIPTGATIEDATVEDGRVVESRIVIKFDEIVKTLEKDVKIDCDSLDPNDPNYDLISPYCQVSFTIVDGEGNVLVDEDGNVLDQIKIDECDLKNYGCYSVKIKYAMCDLERESITPVVIVHYKKVASSRSVRKYIACANPDSSQVMYAFYDKNEIIDGTETQRGETRFKIIPRCNTGTCTNFDTRISENFGKCTSTSPDSTNYGEVYTSYVKDPPLNCILNSKNKSSYYDYSSMFGVNTNLCRVYCTDSVEYVLPDKVKATSGKSFTYDIEFVANRQRKTNKLLSSIVKEKRTCVSEIYYNNMPSESNWKKIYGITDEEINKATGKDTIQNFYDLLSVLVYKSADEGSRKEVINKLVYDLFNCNFYAQSKFDSHLTVPKDITVKNVYEYIKELYGINRNFGLSGCNIGFDSNGEYHNDCITMSNLEYDGGAEVIGKDANIGKKDNNYNYTVSESSNLEVDGNNKMTRESTVNSNVSKIKYCSGSNCFAYDESLNVGSNTKADVYDLSSTLFTTTSKEKNALEIEKTRIVNGKTKKSSIKYRVPANDYAVFEVTTEIGFYNSDEYQTEPGTGKVQNVNKDGEINDYIYLPKYSYPVSKNAFSKCSRTDNSDIRRCNVKQSLLNIATFRRNYAGDQFYYALNNNKDFNCYIDVTKPTTIEREDGTLYRNVELSSLFNPTAPSDSNWLSDEGIIATTQIQSSSSILQTTDEYLEYSITLSPTQVKNIKNDYNKSNNGYSNERIYNCEIIDGTYRNCKSTFLDLLRKGNSENGVDTFGSISSEYNDGVSKHSKGE